MSADEPKLGARRSIEPCPLCGGEQYEEYTSWPVYHNYGWTARRHLEESFPFGGGRSYYACIAELLKRIERLESAKDGKL